MKVFFILPQSCRDSNDMIKQQMVLKVYFILHTNVKKKKNKG